MPHAMTPHNTEVTVHAIRERRSGAKYVSLQQHQHFLWWEEVEELLLWWFVAEVETATTAAKLSSEQPSLSPLTLSLAHPSSSRLPHSLPLVHSLPNTPPLNPTQVRMQMDYIELVLILMLIFCITLGAASILYIAAVYSHAKSRIRAVEDPVYTGCPSSDHFRGPTASHASSVSMSKPKPTRRAAVSHHSRRDSHEVVAFSTSRFLGRLVSLCQHGH